MFPTTVHCKHQATKPVSTSCRHLGLSLFAGHRERRTLRANRPSAAAKATHGRAEQIEGCHSHCQFSAAGRAGVQQHRIATLKSLQGMWSARSLPIQSLPTRVEYLPSSCCKSGPSCLTTALSPERSTKSFQRDTACCPRLE